MTEEHWLWALCIVILAGQFALLVYMILTWPRMPK